MVKAATARRTFSPVSGRTRKLHRTDQHAKELAGGRCCKFRPARSLLTGYRRLSAAIEQPQAARAVGSAAAQIRSPHHPVSSRHSRDRCPRNYRWDPICKGAMIGWEISVRSPLRAGEPYRIHANAA